VPQDDPRSEIEDLDRSRAEAIRASARPAWVYAVMAVLLGVACAIALTRQTLLVEGALVLLAMALVLFWRFTRRKGRLTDDRAVTTHYARYFLLMLPVFVVPMVIAPNAPIWVLVTAGAVVAAGVFAYLRLDERYQVKRLASGDYGPYDLS